MSSIENCCTSSSDGKVSAMSHMYTRIHIRLSTRSSSSFTLPGKMQSCVAVYTRAHGKNVFAGEEPENSGPSGPSSIYQRLQEQDWKLVWVAFVCCVFGGSSINKPNIVIQLRCVSVLPVRLGFGLLLLLQQFSIADNIVQII